MESSPPTQGVSLRRHILAWTMGIVLTPVG